MPMPSEQGASFVKRSIRNRAVINDIFFSLKHTPVTEYFISALYSNFAESLTSK